MAGVRTLIGRLSCSLSSTREGLETASRHSYLPLAAIGRTAVVRAIALSAFGRAVGGVAAVGRDDGEVRHAFIVSQAGDARLSLSFARAAKRQKGGGRSSHAASWGLPRVVVGEAWRPQSASTRWACKESCGFLAPAEAGLSPVPGEGLEPPTRGL